MSRSKKVFLMGASGMGMAPLAMYLSASGFMVEAFDDFFREPLRSNLENSGVTILNEPYPVEKPDYVVRSSAIAASDPRLISFQAKGIKVWQRGEFVAHLSRNKKVLAIVGSHGKTTTSGMLVWALKKAGFDASYMVGGCFRDTTFPPGYFSESSPWLVLELDESDGTIDFHSPEVTVALNCDWDHMDRYKKSGDLDQVFQHLFQRTKSVIITPSSGKLQKWAREESDKTHSTFRVASDPADFMKNNQAAVRAAGKALGIELKSLRFKSFPGMERRQSVLFEKADLTIVEDYAHHPAEIRAFVSDRQRKFPDHWLRMIFQPHRYSRTKALAKSFAEEMSNVDDLQFLPTYGAFEKYDPEGGVDALIGNLPPRLRKSANVHEDFLEFYQSILNSRDSSRAEQLLFVGAGTIDRWAHGMAAMAKSEGDRLGAFQFYLQNRLSSSSGLVENESLGSRTTMGVGGDARWYSEPQNLADLRSLIEASNLLSVPRVMIGRGSNLIVPDDGYDGLVIRLKGPFWSEITQRNDDSLIVGAGARLKEICLQACKMEMKGFEFLEGIPGTLGGALRMNAGAMGWEIFDLVEWVSFLLPDGTIREIPGSEMNVGYRHCKEAVDGIALRAKLRGEGRSDHREIRKAIDKLSRKRRDSQPREASAGCIFRNPEEASAGWLIDQAGLKGESVGGARISEVHGNFIVNEGGATAEDVISLMKKVKRRVRDHQGVELEPEVGLLGKNWKEPLS
ncbi:MAG: UDP-N-acetylmuramate dehydrogenase [Verrucomicrobiota bacterium]|nr:UDP-N-acetylmuramate dehydrogenase [Verrucomicrobiota bacterium]